MNEKLFAPADFTVFYDRYPKHTHRDEALAAWRKLAPSAELIALIMKDIATREWPDDKQFIPNPATYLHKKRWQDEAPKPVTNLVQVRNERSALAEIKEARRKALAASPDQRTANLLVLRGIVDSLTKKGI